MVECQNWEIDENGISGRRLVVRGSWTKAIEEELRREKLKAIELNYAKGWKSGGGYAFLADLADILTEVVILDWNAFGLNVLEGLKGLEVLHLTHCKPDIDWSALPRLQNCSFVWGAKSSLTVLRCKQLRSLCIEGYRGGDDEENMTPFGELSALRSLSLIAPKIRVLQGIENLAWLNSLGLYRARALVSLDGLGDLKHLERLEVNDCPRFESLEPLRGMERLRVLHLCDDGAINSIEPLVRSKQLEEFICYGTTVIRDGNLDLLRSFPLLSRVAFAARRHYTLRPADVVEWIARRRGETQIAPS